MRVCLIPATLAKSSFLVALVACAGHAQTIPPRIIPASAALPPRVETILEAAPLPVPQPPVPLNVRDSAGVRSFLTRLCERATVNDSAWLAAHAQLPLLGSTWVNDNGGDVLVGAPLIEKGADFGLRSFCKEPQPSADDIRVNAEGAAVIAVLEVDGHPTRLVFDASGEGRLLELSVVVPDAPPITTPKTLRSHELRGAVLRETEHFGALVEILVLNDLKQHPACVRSYVAREMKAGHVASAALHVVAKKRDGEAATLRVFPSTVVRASLLRCLEPQLSNALAMGLRGTPFEVEYLLHVLMPVGKDEVSPSDPVIMMGPR